MIQTFLLWDDQALLILRLAIGFILIAHGWPKIKDLAQTAKNFTAMGFKPGRFWGTLVAMTESLGGMLIVIGLLAQLVSLVAAIEFIVIIIWKLKNRMKLVNGYELDLIILSALIALIAHGGGNYSLDNYFGLYLR